MTQTVINQTTSARDIAIALGCSLPTVLTKAKSLGIKFKGRTTEQHVALMLGLAAVKPRPRKMKKTKNFSKQTLHDRIQAHLTEGKNLIICAKEELAELNKASFEIDVVRTKLVKQLELLAEEQKA